MRETPGRPTGVDLHPARFAMGCSGSAKQVGGHHWGQHARDDQREEDRNGSGPAELNEELARHAAHEGGRQENGDQGEGGGDHRQPDFIRGVHCRLKGRLALRQMAHDVFDLDDGVVHQNADDQGHREQGHHVEREAHQIHHGEGRNGGQGQGGGRDQGGAPVAQEQPDDDDREYAALDEQGHRAFEVLDHRVDEIEGFRDGDIGVIRLQFLQCRAHALGDLDLAGSAAADYFETDHRLAVEQCRRTLLGNSVADCRKIAETHFASVGKDDFHGAELFRGLHCGDRAHRLFRPADIGAASRCFLLNLAQLA